MAEVCTDDCRVAKRFELYVGGVELCNGYQELTDAEELKRREAVQNASRSGHGANALPGAPRLLQAMQQGLPRCSGVALGFDRVVMSATGVLSIAEVIPFPTEIA